MISARFVAVFFVLLLTVTPVAAVPPVGHDASQVRAGTFASGNFIFPNNLTTNQYLVVDTNTLFVDSANNRVGIGTTSPTNTFDINGNLVFTGAGRDILFNSGVSRVMSTYAPLSLYADSDNNDASDLIRLGGDGTTSYLTIANGGNIGIGTSPSYALHIVRDGAQPDLALVTYGSSNPVITGQRARGSLAAPTALVTNNGVLQVRGGGYDGSAFQDTRVRMLFAAADNWNTTSTPTFISFETTSLGSTTVTERMRIDSAGNIGIGTTTPGNYKLYVNGSAYIAGLTVSDGSLNFSGNLDMNGKNITNVSYLGVGTTAPLVKLHVSQDGTTVNSGLLGSGDAVLMTNTDAPAGFAGIVASSSAGHRAVFKGTRARGTLVAPAVPSVDDDVLTFLGAIYDGIDNEGTAGIFFKVDGNVSSDVAPQRISFVTSETNALSRTEKMTIKSNGNVGIATTSPQYSLDVNGSLRGGTLRTTTGDVIYDGGFNNARLRLSATGPIVDRNIADSNPALIVHQINAGSTGDILQLKNSSATVAVISNSGNVGIGTTAPTQKLHVVSSSGSVQELIEASAGGSAEAQLDLKSGTKIWRLFARSSDQNFGIFGSGSGTRFRINDVTGIMALMENGGNVGIGTSTPTKILHLVGPANTSTELGVETYGVGSAVAPTFVGRGARGSLAVPAAVQYSDILANFGAEGYDGTQFTGRRAAIRMIAAQNWSSTAHGTYMGFFTASNSTTSAIERMRIAESGNVGIGTTVPSAKLHVVGHVQADSIGYNDNTAGIIEFPASTTEIRFRPSSSSGTVMRANVQGVTVEGGVGGSQGTLIVNRSDGAAFPIATFYEGVNERVRIANTGNVGIGTSSPETKLHVLGKAAIGTGTGTSQLENGRGLWLVENAAGSGTASTGVLFQGGGVAHANIAWQPNERNFVFRTGNFPNDTTDRYGSANLVISGNIGIGITAPIDLLHLQGGDATVRVNALSGDSRLLLTNANGRNWAIRSASDGIFKIRDESSSVDRLVITAANNVGIGTISPIGRLNVENGDSGVSSAAAAADDLIIESDSEAGISILTPNTRAAQIRFGDPQDNGAGTMSYNHSTNAMQFNVNGLNSPAIFIDSGNKVGIGANATQISPSSSHTLTLGDGVSYSPVFDINAPSTGSANIGFVSGSGASGSFLGGISYSMEGAQYAMQFFSGGATERMRIDSLGRVGIGATNPSGAKLVVNDTTASNIDIILAQGSGEDASFRTYTLGTDADRVGLLLGGDAQGNRLWFDDSEQLRFKTSDPSSDDDGTVIGTQTSSLDTKNLKREFTDTEGALNTIVNSPVYTFTYKNGAFDNQEFVGIVTDFSPTFGMDRDAEHPAGKSLNEITAVGYTFSAIKQLNKENEELKKQIETLQNANNDLLKRLEALERAVSR